MTREEAIAIIENEKECVNRANKNDYCNRDCYNCELVKTDTEILNALDMAINALEREQKFLDDTLKGWQEDEDELERKYGAEPLNCGNCEIVQASINTGIRTASRLVDDVLDNMRAEINQYGSIWVQYQIKGHTDKDIEDTIEDVLRQAKEQVLSVIDKYRNEVANEYNRNR